LRERIQIIFDEDNERMIEIMFGSDFEIDGWFEVATYSPFTMKIDHAPSHEIKKVLDEPEGSWYKLWLKRASKVQK